MCCYGIYLRSRDVAKSKSSDTRSTNSSGTHSTHGMEEAFDDEDGTIQVVEFSAKVNLEDGGKRTSMASIKEMSSWMRSYLEKEHDHVFDVEQEQHHLFQLCAMQNFYYLQSADWKVLLEQCQTTYWYFTIFLAFWFPSSQYKCCSCTLTDLQFCYFYCWKTIFFSC